MKNEDGVWNCKNKKIRGLERYLMGAVGAQLIFYFSAFRACITDQWRRAPLPQEFPINK